MSEEIRKKLKEYQKKLSLGLKTCFTNANVSVKVCYKYIFFSLFY